MTEPGMISPVGENAWRPGGRAPTAEQLREKFPDGDGWLTVEQIAEAEDIKPATWRWYYQTGKAGAPKPERRYAGRVPQWRVETIAAWIAARPGSGNFGPRSER